jgi:hypothetical protein
MARPESLLGASRRRGPQPRRAALDPAIGGVVWRSVRELRPDAHVTEVSSRLSVGEAIDLLDDAPTLRLEKLDLAPVDRLNASADSAVTVSATKPFAAWSRRYLMVVVSADALVGGISAAIPASISETLSWGKRVALLCVLGLIVWPTAIALCRGYRRNRIGIGFDEPGAVMRAGMVVVVAGAPSGSDGHSNRNSGSDRCAVLRVTEAGRNRHSVRRAAQPARSFPCPTNPAVVAAPRTQPAACRRGGHLRRCATAQRTHSTRAGCWHEK